MAIRQKTNKTWTRKHDTPGIPLIKKASKILYPENLEDVIEICKNRQPNELLKAAGSHWALSEAALSDHTFIETHDPTKEFSAMGRTIYDVVPKCLTEEFINFLGAKRPNPFDAKSTNENEGMYLVHFEAGKKVYQLYSELDFGDDKNKSSLAYVINKKFDNPTYFGSWAFHTLGGAAGQTVFGALTTGTHGGDFNFPPMADAVLAMHLVADGGKHYWIERSVKTWTDNTSVERQNARNDFQITDNVALRSLYGSKKYGGQDNFEIVRDDNIFNAVLISAGRFGVVYSVVLSAVRQYCLHEERRLDIWQNIKGLISNSSSSLYSNRFLQVAISVTPHDNFTKNLCGITKRWNVPATPNATNPNGRLERRGEMKEKSNSLLNAPLFEKAGVSHSYNPDPDYPNKALPPNFLEKACENGDFIDGAIEAVINEIEDFVQNNAVIAGGAIAAITALGGSGLLSLIPQLIFILAILKILRDLFKDHDTRFGEVMDAVRDNLLNNPSPATRAAGIFAWQCIAYKVFESQQEDLDFAAISYAVMDRHNYLDKSCEVNVDSIEVFFDATDPMLIAFVDALLAYENRQEFIGKAFVGYISLRFTNKTNALIGMEKYEYSCAVEVAGLKDVDGTKQLIDFAISLAKNKNFRGILHWGQRNEHTMEEIQDRFGDKISSPFGKLKSWRNSLSYITENGRLNGFSSDFTRRTGLEIVVPIISFLAVDKVNVPLGEEYLVSWDAINNPPYTEIRVDVRKPSSVLLSFPTLALGGQLKLHGLELGVHTIKLTALCTLNGEVRKASKVVSVTII